MLLWVRVIGEFIRGEMGVKRDFFFTRAALLAIVFLWFFILLAPVTNAQNTDPLAGLEYVEGQIIIKFVDDATENQKKELRSSLNSVPLRKFSLIGAELVQISGMSVEEAINSFKDDPRVEYVEPNYIWHADIIPDDPYFDLLWGMHNTGQTGGTADADIDAVEAWNISTGNSIIIGVIDTGVDTAHVDLLGNIWTNPGEIPNNGIDDDSNGYVDDMHGWDFVNWDNGPIDDNGHGTHCSGTIAGVGNNSVGVAGVCWSAKIMALKFLNAGGSGSTANAILAVEYATMMGANLTSNSWGGGGYSQALKDAIDSSGAHGMLFVAAAGNSRNNNDIYPHYPSSYDLENIIAVAATDHNDELADEATWGSSYGLTSVDLGAPGVSIYSTIPGGGYSYKSGTSMATPHVSGAVALIWSEYPALAHLQIKDRIMSMADSVPDLAGKCVTGSRLNVFMAMAEPDSIPPSPILDLAIAKEEATRITLSWTATGDDSSTGTAAYYDLRYSLSPIDSSNFDSATQVSGEPEPQPAGSTETFVVRSLDFSTTYYFAVQAFDEWNNSSGVSNSPWGTTLGPPDIQVSPDSLSDSLFTNGSSTQELNIANLEEGELFYEVEVEYSAVVEAFGSIVIPAPTSAVSGEAASGHESRTILEEVQFDITGEKVTTGTKDVLLVYADLGSSALKGILEGYPDMGVVDVWYAGPSGGTIPLLSDIEDYDVVVAWNNQAWADMYAIGDVLADYIDDGGAVVTTVDCWSAGTYASHGRYFDQDGYSPFESLGGALFNVRTLGWYDSSHPIMDGVVSLATSSFYNNTALTDGAVEVAQWDDDTPLVATNPHTVAINVWPGDGYYWTGDFPTLIHNAINYAAGGAFWLSVYPDRGEVLPYSDTTLNVNFSAENLEGGDYEATILIESNDPDDSLVSVSVLLHVTDAPDIAVDFDSLDFDIVYIGYPESLSILVSNQGKDTLSVTDIVPDVAEFSVDLTNFVLVPGEDTVVTVTFAPTSVGEVWSNLVISSDDPDESTLTVVLGGEGLICPDIWVDPDSVLDSLFTGETSVETLIVGNSGGSPLYVKVELDNFMEPTASLSGLSIQELLGNRGERNLSYDPDARTTAGLYASGDDGFSNISAAPGDVLASWPAPSPIQHAWGLGFDGHDVWVSDAVGITDNEVSTIGALLSSFSCSGWVGAWPGDIAWDGHFIWQVNVGGDNAIYQLDPATGDVLSSIHDPGHTWDATSQRGLAYDEKEDVFYIGGWNQDRVYKIKGPGWANPGEILNSFDFWNVSGLAWHPGGTLWISVNASSEYIFQVDPETGSVISQFLPPGTGGGYEGAGLALDKTGNLWCVSQATQMVYLVESGVPAYTWLEIAPEACTLGVAETQEFEVRFDATGLFGGDYSADIIISSNDCDQPSLAVPALLNVTGAPDIAVDPDSLDYGIVFIGAAVTDTLVVSNEGTDLLTVSNISSDNSDYTVDTTSFSLNPGENQEVLVTFTPTATGMITGILTITSDDSDEPNLMISLEGEGAEPPDISVSPDSLSDSLFVGETAIETLTISNTGVADLTLDISIELSSSESNVTIIVRERHEQNLLPIPEPTIPDQNPGGKSEYRDGERIGDNQSSPIIGEVSELMNAIGDWESRAPMSQARGQHGLVAHPDGKIYAFGGYAGGMFSSLEIYDATTDSWSSGSNMPSSDRGMAAAIDDYGNIYSFTGVYSPSYRYDPSSDQWTTITYAPVTRAWEAGAANGLDGRIYLIGGEGGSASDPLNLVQIYDPDTDSWSMGSPMPTARHQLGVVAGPGGFIYAIGGRSSGGSSNPLDVVEVYDPVTDTWSSAAPMPTARNQFGISLGADGKIYTIGGKTAYYNNSGPFFDIVEIYDPVTDTWEAGPPLPIERGEMEAVLCDRGIYSIGGTNGSFLALNQALETYAWLYADPTSSTVPAGSSIVIEVTFDATGLIGGDYDGDIVISSNDPDEPEVPIPAHLHVTGIPDIVVDSDSLDFGDVYIGHPESLSLLISNPGTDVLTVTDIVTSLAEFSVDIANFALAPGEDTVVSVIFAPTVTGQVWDTLSISSDDPDEPVYEVLLAGFGRECPEMAFYPDSLGDSLLVGETSTDTLFLENSGLGILGFSFPSFAAAALLNDPSIEKNNTDHDFGFINLGKDEPDPRFGNPVVLGAGGPDSTGYTWIDSDEPGGPIFNFIDISSTGTLVTDLYDDNFVGPLPIGFSFPFYDSSYTEFYIQSNGVINFDSVYIDFDNQPIPQADGKDNLLAWCWRDLYGGTGEVYYQKVGNKLVIQFVGYGEYNDSGTVDAEVIIYPTGTILFQYDSFNKGFDAWGSTVGIENADGTDGLQVAFNTTYLHDDLAILFSRSAYWISGLSPASGTIPSGDSLAIEVAFSAAYVTGGYYSDSLEISSNACDNPDTLVPVYLYATGIPDIAVSEDSLEYGDVFVGYSLTDTLIIFNQGTDVLIVSNISSDNSDYDVDTTSFSVNPWESQEVLVTLAPSIEGEIAATLTIESNDPDDPAVAVVLHGSGLIPPDITVYPDSLSEELLTGETSTQFLTIDNSTGGSDLTFDITIEGAAAAAVAVKVRSYAQSGLNTIVNRLVPGDPRIIEQKSEIQDSEFYNIYGKVSSDDDAHGASKDKLSSSNPSKPVIAGAGDVIRTIPAPGRVLGLTWLNGSLWTVVATSPQQIMELDPADGSVLSSVSMGPGNHLGLASDGNDLWVCNFSYGTIEQYSTDGTLLKSWYAPMGSRVRGIAWDGEALWIGGANFGVLYRADTDGNVLETRTLSTGVVSWVMDMEWIPQHLEGQLWIVDAGSYNDLNQFDVGPEPPVLIQDFAHPDPYATPEGVAHDGENLWLSGFTSSVIFVVDDGIEEIAWLSADPICDTIPARYYLDVAVIFDAAGLRGGEYRADILISSNDPAEPTVAVPVYFQVTDAPDIALSEDTLDYGDVFVSTSISDTLIIYNEGTDSLMVIDVSSDNSDFDVDATSFWLAPDESRNVPVVFTPSTRGTITGTLTIASHDPDEPIIMVHLRGQGVEPPDISVSPDSLSAGALVGQTSTRVLTISNRGVSDLTFDISIEEPDTTSAFVKTIADQSTGIPEVVAVGKPVSLDQLDKQGLSFVKRTTIKSKDSSDKGVPSTMGHSKIEALRSMLGEEVFGNKDNQFYGGPRTRGNLFACTNSATLKEHRLYLNPSVATQMWFLVYEGNSQVGTYDLISASDVTPAGPGEGWYSSGAVNVGLVDGKYYLIVASFQQSSYYYNQQGISPYPIPASFGELTAGAGWDWAPTSNFPPNPTQNVPAGAFGDPVAYYQTLVIGAAWLDVEPASGTIPGRDSLDIAVAYDAAEVPIGDYFAELVITSNDPDEPELTVPVQMRVVARGDVNGDFEVTISDVVYLLNYLFKSGPAPDPVEAGDAYCDDKVDAGDVVYLINYLFKSGPPPCP